jgi:hypothetical protein
VPEQKVERGLELSKRLLELSDEIIGILPLGDPGGSFDWRTVKEKILTKEDAAELVRLASEIQEVRDELDRL